MRQFLSIVALLASCLPALAQSGTPTKQSGNVTPSHATCWTTNGIVQDCGTAAVPFLTSIGTVGQGQTICAWTALSTAPGSQKLCLGVFDSSAATITLQNFGIDTPQSLNFVINGVTYPFPFTVGGIVGPGSSTVGDVAIWNNVAGSLLKDVPPLQIFGTQSANCVFAGPVTGSAAFPTCRALVAADISGLAVPWSNITGTPTTVAGYGITNVRTSETTATTYYVNGDASNPQTCGTAGQFTGGSACRAGADSGNCLTPATACLTAQFVLTKLLNSIDMAGQTTIINGAHCTGDTNCGHYAISCVGPIIGLASVSFTGDSTATSAVKIIPSPTAVGVFVKDQCTINLSNIAFADNSTNNAGGFIKVGLGNYGHIDVATVTFGGCTVCNGIEATYGGSITFTDSGSSSTGGKALELYAHDGGVIDFIGATFAGASSLTYTSAFAEIVQGGIIDAVNGTFTGFASINAPRCIIFGPYNFIVTNPNAIFPGNSDCVTVQQAGAIGLQTGSGGSSSFVYGSVGQPLVSGGALNAKDTWATNSQMQAFVAPGLLYYTLAGINFNSATTDNIIPLTNFPTGMTRFQVDRAVISNASHTLVTATIGIFTTTGGSGTIAADQAITVSSTSDATNNNSMSLTLTNAATTAYVLANLAHTPNLYARIGTPEGAAATGDVTLEIRPLP